MNGSVRIYQGLLRCYPRRFRDEYGTDMALLFGEQLRDEPTARVWARGVVDLAITVPTIHLEAHMNKPANTTVPILYTALSAAGLVFALVVGSSLGLAAIGLTVAAVAGVLAVVSWRRTRASGGTRSASARWWQVLAAGAGVLAATIAVVNIVGEVSSGWWGPMVLALLSGILLTITGLLLGIAHLASNRLGSASH
jgi:hypothetical protein